jgi:hypothetical protein
MPHRLSLYACFRIDKRMSRRFEASKCLFLGVSVPPPCRLPDVLFCSEQNMPGSASFFVRCSVEPRGGCDVLWHQNRTRRQARWSVKWPLRACGRGTISKTAEDAVAAPLHPHHGIDIAFCMSLPIWGPEACMDQCPPLFCCHPSPSH